MEKVTLKQVAPWIGPKNAYPMPGDEGFREYRFTPEQVSEIHDRSYVDGEQNSAGEIIRTLSAVQFDSEADFLKAVRAAVGIVPVD